MRISGWSSDVCASYLTVALDKGQEEKGIARLKAHRDDAYEECIDKCDDFGREVAKEVDASHFTYAELEENDVDLKKLQGWLTKIRKLDFYGAARAAEAEERLKGCQAVLAAYATQVFEAHEDNGCGSRRRYGKHAHDGAWVQLGSA